jgi:type III secretory pathway component EscT
MGLATSIIVFAVGAILKFATTVHSSSFNIQTIGVILIVVGVVGFIVSIIFWCLGLLGRVRRLEP